MLRKKMMLFLKHVQFNNRLRQDHIYQKDWVQNQTEVQPISEIKIEEWKDYLHKQLFMEMVTIFSKLNHYLEILFQIYHKWVRDMAEPKVREDHFQKDLEEPKLTRAEH